MIISSLLIGCNNSEGNIDNKIIQSTKEIAPAESQVIAMPEEKILSDMKKDDIKLSRMNQKNTIGESKAKEIALNKVPNCIIVELSFDNDDYLPNYDISISDSTYEYDFEINALDGSIIENNKEYIENN